MHTHIEPIVCMYIRVYTCTHIQCIHIHAYIHICMINRKYPAMYY